MLSPDNVKHPELESLRKTVGDEIGLSDILPIISSLSSVIYSASLLDSVSRQEDSNGQNDHANSADH